MNREITKQARKDKQMWKVERLQELSDVKEAWRNIRYEKKPFIPNFYSMKDMHGNRVPMIKKAHALAEYLYEKQWAPKRNPSHVDPHRRKIIDKDLNIPTSEFSYTEVQEAIRKLRTNKAPGPDGVINELFQYLDLENIQQLTRCLNILWNKKHVPDEFAFAQIVFLYKKGNHENPENYRPISLLNTTYNIFANILEARIANAIDAHIGST